MFGQKKGLLDVLKKPVDPKELVRKWQADIRQEQRGLERQIREIDREKKLAEKQVRDAAKRGDMSSARTLAKEIVRTKKVIGQLYVNKAHLVSMNAQLTEQLGMVKVAGTLSKSTEVMKIINDLIKVPVLMQTMQSMAKEMMKAGIIDEMMEDMMDSAMDTEDMEEETDAEVDKVLTEIAGDTLAALAGSAAPARKAQPATVAQEPAEAEEDDGLQARLNAVRS